MKTNGFLTTKEVKSLIENKEDYHTATAARMFDVTKSEVSVEQRQKAKVYNFGFIYGAHKDSLLRLN